MPCRIQGYTAWQKSTFTNIIALSDGGKCVEVYSEIEWQSLRTLAKEQFSFNVSNGTATFDLGLGAIKGRICATNSMRYLLKIGQTLQTKRKSGVSVISECKYGWDKFNDNTLRFTVLHTPKHNYRIDSMQSMMDLGLNRYSFAIFSHKGDVGTDTQLEARKFITPMTAYICKSTTELWVQIILSAVFLPMMSLFVLSKKPKTAMKLS